MLTLCLPPLLLWSPAAAAPPVPALDAKHLALFETYCVSCHGPDKQKGNFRIDDLPFSLSSVETAEKWQKVLNARKHLGSGFSRVDHQEAVGVGRWLISRKSNKSGCGTILARGSAP